MRKIQQWWAALQRVPGVHFVVNVFQRFGDDNGGFYAAGLAFFVILSFAPILITGISVLGFFINVHTASTQVTEMIQNLLPRGGARDEMHKFLTTNMHLDQQVRSVINHRGIAGVFGFLSLLWATIQIFINASIAMNAMWEVKETRNWFLVRGLAVGLLIVTSSLTVFSLLLSGAPSAVADFKLPVIHHLPVPLPLLTVLFEIIALMVNAGMYTLIYKWLPNAIVSWRSAAVGGITSSILFEVAKKLVASYLLKANHSIYGDLANLILFILWIYYSMTILLLGAEVTAAFGKATPARPTPRRIALDKRAQRRVPTRGKH